MLKHKRWALFDADDTLIGVEVEGQVMGTNQSYFSVVSLFEEAMKTLGFDPVEVRSKQQEIDRELCLIYGFARRARFPRSFRLSYKALCRKYKCPYSKETARDLEQIGWKVFAFQAVPLPGALDVLQRAGEHYNVGIVTKGNERHQRKKVVDAGCRGHTGKVIVMSHKTVEEWQTRVVRALGIDRKTRRESWVVGDSIRSDINPSLELGFNAIHVINGHAWGFEEAHYASSTRGATLGVVHNIQDVLRHIFPGA